MTNKPATAFPYQLRARLRIRRDYQTVIVELNSQFCHRSIRPLSRGLGIVAVKDPEGVCVSHSNLEQSKEQSGISNNMQAESALAYTPESQAIYRLATRSRNKPVTSIPNITLEDNSINKESEKGPDPKHRRQWRIGNAVFEKTV